MGIEWISVILLVVICIVSVYTDYSKGLILNRFLFVLGIPAIIVHIIAGFILENTSLWSNMIVSMLGVILSFVLFYMKIWAGGDSKLYAIIVLATPWSLLSRTVWGISYVFIIPIFAFAFGFIYLIVESLFKIIKDHGTWKDLFKSTAKGLLQYAKYLVAIVFFDHLLGLLFERIHLTLSTWLLILINLLI